MRSSLIRTSWIKSIPKMSRVLGRLKLLRLEHDCKLPLPALEVPERVRRWYTTATHFRFTPVYDQWMDRDLDAWTDELRNMLAGVHLSCEAARLRRPGLTWDTYWGTAVTQAAKDGATPRHTARQVRDLIRGPRAHYAGAAVLDRIRWHWIGRKNLLALVAPVVFYGLGGRAARARATAVLGCASDDDAMLRGYLRAWGRDGDPNFDAALRRFGVRLSTPEAA